jgi:hypothetical protein
VSAVCRLVRQEVTDYGATWTVVAKKLAPSQEFQNFLHIFGIEAAQRHGSHYQLSIFVQNANSYNVLIIVILPNRK